MAGSARDVVLEKIRAATAPAGADAAIAREWEEIERGYRVVSDAARDAVLAQFEERLKDYDAGVYRAGAQEVGGLVAQVLRERGVRRVAIAADAAWKIEGVECVPDRGGSVEAIDGCDGVLTGAVCGIAETGTIVLQNEAVGGQGRRALTLLPDYHLCVIAAADVVQTVPEAVARLAGRSRLATTFFSGPSATADIEMTRIKGVHGPRFVDVVVVI